MKKPLDKQIKECYNKSTVKEIAHEGQKEVYTMTKVTKRDNFNAIVAVLEEAGKPELVAVMKHELELLEKKNSYKSTKPTKTQVANAALKAEIVDILKAEPNRLFTASEVLKALDNPELSGSKVTSMITQLKNDGIVVRTEDKRKAYFQIA